MGAVVAAPGVDSSAADTDEAADVAAAVVVAVVVGKQSRLVVNETGQRMEGANTVAQEHLVDQLGGSQLDSLLRFQLSA